MPDLLVSGLCGVKSDATFCMVLVCNGTTWQHWWTYEVSQMDMALRVEQHVVRLDVPVHDSLLVDVSDSASKLCYPKAHCLFCEGLSRNVKAQITTVHQIEHDVAAPH